VFFSIGREWGQHLMMENPERMPAGEGGASGGQ
jgi:hypothetical protein